MSPRPSELMIESLKVVSRDPTGRNLDTHIDLYPGDERTLLRKIDFKLIPWFTLLFLLSYLDRASIGNAKLYGLEQDLHMTDKQFLLCLTIFFFSYSIFEVPSNILLKRLRPSVWLSSIVSLWGVMMTTQGLVHDYRGLLVTRWMLGLFEAGLLPGLSYYFSCWYTRSQFGKRLAIFMSAVTASGAFGGLLAAAISKMHGVGGKPGWAWIFILEGLTTIIAGVASFWIIEDFPETAKFLNEAERTYIIGRLQADDRFSAAGEKFNVKYIWQSFSDWKTWIAVCVGSGIGMPLHSFSLFLPTIIKQLGFKATAANLLSVPVFFSACCATLIVGFLGDRLQQRGYITIACGMLAAAGYIILFLSRNASISYVGVYLAACGVYPTGPNTIAWISSNVEGSYKRSVTIAMVLGFANLNGAVSSNVYRANDRPFYRLGHLLVLMYILMGIIAAALLRLLLKAENARRDRGERDEIIGEIKGDNRGKEKNGKYASVDEARSEKGDQWSGYRYTL